MSWSRRQFISSVLGSAVCTRVSAQEAIRPNILVVVADDLGWGDTGYANPQVRTPNIDALASQGVRFTQFRTAPVCSPTRAGLLTGRSPLRIGIDRPLPRGAALPASERLLPEYLREAGYQTSLIGKWHLGSIAPGYHPNQRGFDHFYGYLGGEVDYFTHQLNGRLDWQRNGETVEEEGYTTDLLEQEALRLIRGRDTERPFFMTVSFNAPHVPLMAKESDLARWPGVENANRRTFLAMLESMDEAFGNVVETLRQENALDNTVLVWMSDNGGNDRAGGADNGGLRGRKGQAFEGGIRVPAFFHWPEGLPGGWEFDKLSTMMDWFPTLLTAAGVPLENPPELDGVDLWPLLKDGRNVDRHPVVLGQVGSIAVLHNEWKLVEHETGAQTQLLLFRYLEDPAETNDLAGAYPEVVEELVQVLRDHPRGSSDVSD